MGFHRLFCYFKCHIWLHVIMNLLKADLQLNNQRWFTEDAVFSMRIDTWLKILRVLRWNIIGPSNIYDVCISAFGSSLFLSFCVFYFLTFILVYFVYLYTPIIANRWSVLDFIESNHTNVDILMHTLFKDLFVYAFLSSPLVYRNIQNIWG